MSHLIPAPDWQSLTPRPGQWPRPPSALPAGRLDEPHEGARVCVAGLVLVRQRPGTAKGVIFVTLEDETGVANVVIWAKVYERFRRAVIAGRLQRQSGVVHVVAEQIEDLSALLDQLLRPDFNPDFAPTLQPDFRPELARAGDQP
jgi:DNA polymerase III alpha subunit